MDNQEFERRVFEYLRDYMTVDADANLDYDGYGSLNNVTVRVKISLFNPTTGKSECVCSV